jgi:hypothetical protein
MNVDCQFYNSLVGQLYVNDKQVSTVLCHAPPTKVFSVAYRNVHLSGEGVYACLFTYFIKNVHINSIYPSSLRYLNMEYTLN